MQHLIQGAALFGDRKRAERMVGARYVSSLFFDSAALPTAPFYCWLVGCGLG